MLLRVEEPQLRVDEKFAGADRAAGDVRAGGVEELPVCLALEHDPGPHLLETHRTAAHLPLNSRWPHR